MDRDTKIELEQIRAELTALSGLLDGMHARLDGYGHVIDMLAKADKAEKNRFGIYVADSNRYQFCVDKIKTIVDTDNRAFKTLRLRRLCRFPVGQYLQTMIKLGYVEHIARCHYRVTDVFFEDQCNG